ncbi:hypothetical protein HPG69_005115, partial [Diceros bicornis minor]
SNLDGSRDRSKMAKSSGGYGPGGGKKMTRTRKRNMKLLSTRVGKKKEETQGPDAASKLPLVTPYTQCQLKLLKLKRIKDCFLMEEEFIRRALGEIVDDKHAVLSTSVGSGCYLSILSFVDKDLLEPPCLVLLNCKVHAVTEVLMDDTDPLVTVMRVEKSPQETYADEIRESVELPFTHPKYYEERGIKPPQVVILCGPLGTGKTLLAKAKYLGDRPKLVQELFRVAEEHEPSIVFIDAIGTKMCDSDSGGEREIQQTVLELLNQLDGFDSRGDVKVIMATNQIENLNPALIRPGHIDREIEFPLPDQRTKKLNSHKQYDAS